MEKKYNFKFTVFTPTFNRSNTIGRVFKSLKEQTFKDFEWLIVDDGSNDNTVEVVESFKKKADFPIRYFCQNHGGKHVAFRQGIKEAHGELFLPLDSDDSCVPEALECFLKTWESIPKSQIDNFTGVTGLCLNQYGSLIGEKFPFDVTDSDSLEIKYKYKITGDKWGFHKTDILRKFHFPDIKHSNFIPEGILWSAIAKKYKTRFINKPLSIVHIDQTSRLSTADPAKHATGHSLWHQSILNDEIEWFRTSPKSFFISAVHYCRFSFHARISINSQQKELNNSVAKVLWFTLMPLGYLVYLRDVFLNRNKRQAS